MYGTTSYADSPVIVTYVTKSLFLTYNGTYSK